MSGRISGWTRHTVVKADALHTIELPLFLCPALVRQTHSVLRKSPRRPSLPCAALLQRRFLHLDRHSSSTNSQHESVQSIVRLPQQCTGCGALSQTSDREEPGFFSLGRKSVKAFLTGGIQSSAPRRLSEDQVVQASLAKVEPGVLKSLRFDKPAPSEVPSTPLCDRCHKLLHHQSGTSIHHPSIQSIHDTILESPHKYNHVYHILDAADFPMTLVPGLHRLLHLTPQRSLNRRSKNGKFYHGRKTEISFIITRSDLLAPMKSQVDSMMPYLVSVLRDALGSSGKDVRLGNMRCVSAKRGWWTKEVKEDIWNRGGGGWMVGKVNVGKSQLFETVFPKGRCGTLKVGRPFAIIQEEQQVALGDSENFSAIQSQNLSMNTTALDTSSLLPPLPQEVDYPAMPLVSALPGTTSSPIRVPFGNGKGELVDLPGISRGDLELYVQEPHRSSLVMRSRVQPEQQVIKPGQSLLLGGFLRITPKTPATFILAYAFTPISSHLTSTDKAVGIQTQVRESGVLNIANRGVGEKIRSAGTFPLKWDVTKQRSGPITAPDAVGIKVDGLPYRVLSTDILIEGCGWVELVAQVRKKSLESCPNQKSSSSASVPNDNISPQPLWPEVEVFSPEGKFIRARKPLGAWLLAAEKKSTSRPRGRPRQSMKGVKKRTKMLRRETSES